MLEIFISKVENAFIMIKQLFLQEGGGGLKSPSPSLCVVPAFAIQERSASLLKPGPPRQ